MLLNHDALRLLITPMEPSFIITRCTLQYIPRLESTYNKGQGDTLCQSTVRQPTNSLRQ